MSQPAFSNEYAHSLFNASDRHNETQQQQLLQFGPWKIQPAFVAVVGICLLLFVLFSCIVALWFLSFRLRRREKSETEYVKQRAREQFESKQPSTPSARKKLEDKEAEKRKEELERGKSAAKVPTVNSIDSANAETIEQFERRVRESFAHDKIVADIKNESSPDPERKIDSVSSKSFDNLSRNDSKMNMFVPADDAHSNQPALGSAIDLQHRI